jgi:hypothetical protein
VPEGYRETVTATLLEVRPGVYLTLWQGASGATVIQHDDFETGVVHSRTTLPGTEFQVRESTLKVH